MSQTTIYLNQAKLNNQEFIRLLYKADERIKDIIKKNDWIVFHTELKSYCVKKSEQNINIIKDLFKGIAIINTYYLNAIPKIKADDIIINKAITFNHILPGINKDGSMLLIPYDNEGIKVILLKYKYNQKVYNDLKQADYLKWDSKHKTFYFLAKKPYLYKFILDYSEKIKINLHQKLVINDLTIKKLLLEQHYKKSSDFKSCPLKFIEAMAIENKSMNTITTYHHMLLKFINTYKSCSLEQINNFTEQQINDYHSAMQQSKSFSPVTINQSVNALKYYYSKVLKREISYDGISRANRNRKLPSYYSKEEITKIINVTVNIKHKAMLMLMFSAGIRISELLDLKPCDILSDVMQVHVKESKGRKDRYTLLSVKTLKVLRTYFKECKPKDYLFEGMWGGKYSKTSFRKVLDKSTKLANVNKKGSSHVLRHTFATHLLEAGVDIRYIQELLGHSSSKTTEIYTHVTNKHIQQIKNPLDNLDV